jgi:hypothetical protein
MIFGHPLQEASSCGRFDRLATVGCEVREPARRALPATVTRRWQLFRDMWITGPTERLKDQARRGRLSPICMRPGSVAASNALEQAEEACPPTPPPRPAALAITLIRSTSVLRITAILPTSVAAEAHFNKRGTCAFIPVRRSAAPINDHDLRPGLIPQPRAIAPLPR